MDKFVKLVADGECPNANCSNDGMGYGDIENTGTIYHGDGTLTQLFCCECGTEWALLYYPVTCNVTKKPKNYKQIESEK